MSRLDPSNITQHWQRVHPFAARPATPTAQLFSAYSDSSERPRPVTADRVTQLQGRGVVGAPKPHQRSGLRQKDGFDLELTRSCMAQFRFLPNFRADVVSKIRKTNSRSLDATTGAATEKRRRREEAVKAKAKARLTTAQEHENWQLDGVLARLRIAVERALVSGRYGADLRYFEGVDRLSIPQLRAALRGAFNLELNRKELELLVKHFDHDGDGAVDYLEVKAALMTPSRGLVRRLDQDAQDRAHPFARVMAKFRAVASMPPPGVGAPAGGTPEAAALAKQRRRARRKLEKARHAAEQHGPSDCRPGSASVRAAQQLSRAISEEAAVTAAPGAFSLRKVFDIADANNDGEIDEGEFTACMARFGLELSEEECATVFGVLDPEGDGSIRFEELVWVYFNAKLAAEKHAPLTSHRPTRTVAPWVPNAASASSREAVSEDRRHAYVVSAAPFREGHHDALREASHANARALEVHDGAAFRSLGGTDYRVRSALYGSDNFLHAPRAGTMPMGGGTIDAREHRLPAQGRFGTTTCFFRGNLASEK